MTAPRTRRPGGILSARVLMLWMAATAASAIGPACTLLLDFERECEDASACPEGLVCDRGFCVLGETSDPTALVQGPCQSLIGVQSEDALGPDTVLLGSILPLSSTHEPDGRAMQQALALAVDEINAAGGVAGKKLAVLSCDSASSPQVARTAAQRLVSAAQVPAIVGPASSEAAVDVLESVALRRDVVLVSPTARATAMTDLADDGLLWRTAPTEATEGVAIAELLLSRGVARVAVAGRDDDYGASLRDALESRLCGTFPCNNGDRYLARTYGSDGTGTAHADLIAGLASFEPEALVLTSTLSDGIDLLRPVSESGSDLTTALPTLQALMVTSAMDNPALVSELGHSDVLCTMAGTRPQRPSTEAAESGSVYAAFEARFRAAYGQSPGADEARTYDAVYVLAYAVGAALSKGVDPPTGRSVSENLAKLSSGTRVEVGPNGLSASIERLAHSGEGSVDVVGVSGPLDFDEHGDPAVGIEAWVVDLDQNAIESFGLLYTHDGTYAIDAEAEQALRGRGAACSGTTRTRTE